ncbi:MAG: HPP family protein [Rhodocyclaceae bacterium]
MPVADLYSALHSGKTALAFLVSHWPGKIGRFLGIPAAVTHGSEQWVAALGALLGVATVVLATHALLGQKAAVFVVPSLGATAVLVFAAPHSVFAQPWSVLGGNLLSALSGVLCQQLLPDTTVAAATAVAVSIAIMHAARCIHPPGGATALAAVIGGPDIHQLGFTYALYPVGLNCLILIGVGIAFNYPFAWRRYPASLMRYVHVDTQHSPHDIQPSEEHVRRAMERLNVVIDVSPAELQEVIEQSLVFARGKREIQGRVFAVGRCYASRRPGRHWSVRQVLAEQHDEHPENDVITYRIVDGKGRQHTSSCTRNEFAHWAGRELRPRKPLR